VQRGGYTAEYGDRTYGVFNVVTRSGFERNDEGELLVNYGSFNSTDDELSFGSHSDKFAYFTSISGNRSDLGLETPIENVIHDQAAGVGQFNSLIYNPSNTDQFRLITSMRGDHYQIPNDLTQQATGIRDVEDERDAFVNFSWVHTVGQGIVLTVAPFYHFNRADYSGGLSDTPIIPRQNRGSNYAGGVATVAVQAGTHNMRFGFEGFGQHDDEFFSVVQAGGRTIAQMQTPTGDSESLYAEDHWRATPWLTFNGGIRLNRFSGLLTETAADPRLGAAVQFPMHWVLRGFYGRYYQPPPLDTVSGPLLQFAAAQGFGFLPLRGERDEQAEIGLSIPARGWTSDFDVFRTHAHNFFDHDVIGNSNIFLPLTIQAARIYGGEGMIKSPEIAHHLRLHIAYSHQFAEGRGGVSGGLTDFFPPGNQFFFLDHDQRDTLELGSEATLPWRSWISASYNFGSGFLNGNGPEHLPAHYTFDLSLGKSVGENWEFRLDAMNVGNNRYLLDNSNTFGGTHWVNPREISGSVRWKFHY
jgi:outer membrane receptor protein involved in Fe transport